VGQFALKLSGLVYAGNIGSRPYQKVIQPQAYFDYIKKTFTNRERPMSTNWNRYFYHTFPAELREFASKWRPQHHCPHCQAPKHRRALVDGDHLSELSHPARFCWYALTLIDQGMFTHFRASSDRWVKATGGYPLPVANIGFGCVAVTIPAYLLKPTDSLEDWSTFLEFWLDELDAKLHSFTGVTPTAFFEAVRTDRDMLKLQKAQPLERLLLEKAGERWKTETNQS